MTASSPPLIDSAINHVAFKLLNSDNRQIGMATVISSEVALTAAHLVEDHQEYFLEPILPPDYYNRLDTLFASVIVKDREMGFAALSFDSSVTDFPPNIMVPEEPPGPGVNWHSAYSRALDEEVVSLSGRIEGVTVVGERSLLKLVWPGSGKFDFESESDGAPVMVGPLIVGVMLKSEGKGELGLTAIPTSEMMKSPAWNVVEAAMQAPAAATEPERSIQQFRVTEKNLNLRQGPGTDAPVIDILFANHVVEKQEESADKKWFRVRTKKDGAAIEGWVAARDLDPTAWQVTTSSPQSTTPFDSIAFIKRLSGSSSNAMAHAVGMRVAQRQSEIHMEHLIGGLFQKERGPTCLEFLRVGLEQDQLAELIKAEVGTALPPPGSYHPILITDEPLSLSAHVKEALVAATALANLTGSESIRSRHLIRGALSITDCKLIQALLRRGVDPERILLVDEPDPSKQPTARRSTQAGIKSDDPEGDDLLDIKHEVEALCTVLASRDVTPPISLGLFGDWGSGKSFFMKKMEARFKQLQEIARQEDSAYCSNIVQLWFNAWHYMDTNLWASLATEIFDELAQELARQDAIAAGKDPDYERAQLVAKRADANQELAKANQEKRDADAKLRANQQQLQSIRSGETEVEMDPQAVLREGYRFAVQQPEVRQTIEAAEGKLNARVAEAARTLNIAPADSAKAQLLELQGLWGYLRAIGLAMRNTNKTRLVLMLAAFVVVSVAVIWLLPMIQSLNWVQAAWVRATGLLLALLAAIAPFVPVARRAIQILHDAIKANQEAIEKARLETEKKLQSRHQQLQQTADEAQQKLQDATATAQQLAEQLDNLRSDRKMSNFIRQRQQSSDYTKYLGVIARARNDFEQLSTLLAKENDPSAQRRRAKKRAAAAANLAAQETKTPESEEDLLPPIDRIILYIDDLDRCPEDKVVDVLQAVHLLLAFPLFVVVVGVDPRWLLHSLRQHSKAFQDQIEDGDSTEEERTHWRSTPLNYLEKIFQIPFTLRPMGEAGFGKMIETLIKPPLTDGREEEPEELPDAAPAPVPAEGAKPEAPAAGSRPVPDTTAESQSQSQSQSEPQPRVTDVSAEPPAAVIAPAADASWTTKFFGFLKRTFGNASTPADAADSASQKTVGSELAAVERAAAEQAATQEQSKQTASESSTVQQPQTANTQTVIQIEAEKIEPRPDHLLIHPWEQNFMKQLHELIPSPRATKRFINIYRLIRASVDLDDKIRLEDFTGAEGEGKYRPVLLLLGILTGYPDQATEILRELLENEHKETWWEFVDSFQGARKKAWRRLHQTERTRRWAIQRRLQRPRRLQRRPPQFPSPRLMF